MEDRVPEVGSPTRCCSRLTRILLGAGFAMVLTGGLAYAFWPQSDSEPTRNALGTAQSQDASQSHVERSGGAAEKQPVKTVLNEEPDDERMRRTIIGRWETDRDSGHRDLIVREDGTATIHVNITSLLGQALFATKELDLEIEWQIEEGVLHFKTVGGKPKPAIEFLKKSYGESIAYRILECTDERFLVKDGGNDPDHDWRRVAN